MAHSHQRYTMVAILLHWTIAALILMNIGVGLVMEGLPQAWKAVVVPFHFSTGMTILALTAARILWRLTHRPPPFPRDMAPLERAVAHAAHGLLYALMVVMPLIGWMIISSHPPRPQGAAMIWGVLRLPAIAPIANLADAAQKTAHGRFVAAHVAGAWILIGLLVLHIAGAVKHQWFDRQPELARMGIGKAAQPGGSA